MKKFLIILFLVLNVNMFAKDYGPWYIGADYGISFTDSGVDSTTGSTSLDDKNSSYRFTFGYKFKNVKYLAMELQYLNFGNSEISGNNGDTFTIDGRTYTFNADDVSLMTSGDSFGSSIVVDFPIDNDIIPYARFGYHLWQFKTTGSSSVGNYNGLNDGGNIFYGFGTKVNLVKRLDAKIEYQNLEISQGRIQLATIGFNYTF